MDSKDYTQSPINTTEGGSKSQPAAPKKVIAPATTIPSPSAVAPKPLAPAPSNSHGAIPSTPKSTPAKPVAPNPQRAAPAPTAAKPVGTPLVAKPGAPPPAVPTNPITSHNNPNRTAKDFGYAASRPVAPGTSTPSTEAEGGVGGVASTAVPPSLPLQPLAKFANEAGSWTGDRDTTFHADFLASPATMVAFDKAFVAANDPPVYFQRDGVVVKVAIRKDGTPMIVTATDDDLWGAAQRWTRWVKGNDASFHEVVAPRQIGTLYRVFPGKTLPIITGLATAPFIRRDGTAVTAPGFDPVTGIYLHVPPGEVFHAVPDKPTEDDVAYAVGLLDGIIYNFPYVDESDRTNAFALLLSPHLREVVGQPAPAGAISKNIIGVGSSLLADIISIIMTGETTAPISQIPAGAKGEQLLVAVCTSGAQMLLIDNISQPVRSGALASFLTSGRMGGRITGSNKLCDDPAPPITLLTGVNIRTSDEIARRLVLVQLHSDHPHPADYIPPDGWVVEDPKNQAREHRGWYLWSILTIIRHWFASGCPMGKDHMGSFERWASVLGGILGLIGKQGFLGNVQRLRSTLDDETGQWTALVEGWWLTHQSTVVGAGDLVKVVERFGLDISLAGDTAKKRSSSLGYLLRDRHGRQYGSYRIVQVDARTGNSNGYRLTYVAPPAATNGVGEAFSQEA